MKSFKEKLLEYYLLNENEYLDLSKEITKENLPSPFKYKKMDEVVDFLHKAVKRKDKILIYGDYDCDGILSTSILYLSLKTDTYTPGFYIPFRETDGYGLTKENIDRFYSLGYRILILSDNGITLNDEVDYANNLGMIVLIFDHHTEESTLPNAKYILHPKLCEFSSVNMCAGSVAFFFSYAYLGFIDDYLLTLSMITTISDMMELIGINRIIVKLGLDILNKNRYTNIVKLINPETPLFTENNISMEVAPKVNAVGRIITDNKLFNIVRYFINFDDDSFIENTAQWIESTNKYRKDLVTAFSTQKTLIDDNMNSIIVKCEDLKEGLTGLVASRFMEEYQKPTVVLTKGTANDYILKGSIRSKNGFDINIILNDLSDILLTYGGHQNAGGLSLKADKFDEFKIRFEKAALKHPFENENKRFIEININEISKENYDFMRTLAPFGQGFKQPDFVIKNINKSFFKFSNDQKHIITRINPNSSIVGFNYDKKILSFDKVNLYGSLDINYYRGYSSIQFKINSVQKVN